MFLHVVIILFQFLRWFVQDSSYLVIISIHLLFSILPVDSSKTFSSLCYIYLNPFFENKWYAKSVACHQFKLVKDKQNIILILVSSKWLIPYSRGSSNSWSKLCHLLFFPESKFSQLYYHGDSSKSLQGFTLCFQLLFPSVWSSFCYRSSSGRLYMVVHQGFNSFSKCSSRFFSKKLRLSSYCNPECNSFYRIIRGGIMSFLIIWVHVSWFTCC